MFYFPVSTVAVLVTIGLLASLAIVARLVLLRRRGNRGGIRRMLAIFIPLWALGLAVAVLPASPQPDPSIPSGTFNWVPFLAHRERDLGIELAANLGLFVPLGLMLAFYWRTHAVAKTTLVALAASCSIEVTQLLMMNNRAADITDIITNTSGAFLAACLGWILCRVFPPVPEQAPLEAAASGLSWP